MSVATVSRVFNGSGPVSEETRRLIREVAGRMRYVPHSGARSLITSKTETLGVLLPDLYGEFFSEVIRGMDDTAQRNGFHLLISRAYADRHGIETAMRAMRGRVDGVVAMSPDLDADSLLNLPSTIPVVLLCSVAKGSEIDSLTIQNCRGAREMVSAFDFARAQADRDHQGLAAQLRRGGEAARISNGAARGGNQLRPDRSSARAISPKRRDTRRRSSCSRSMNRPTAIFAANDSMAIGALSALRESGVARARGNGGGGLRRHPARALHGSTAFVGARADLRARCEGGGNAAPRNHAQERSCPSSRACVDGARHPSLDRRRPAERPPPKTLNREMVST